MTAPADGEGKDAAGPRTKVVVVTGLSGAGKSTAMSALEDLGLYCVENLPPNVIDAAVSACEARGVPEIALGVGIGIEGFVDEAVEELTRLAGGRGVPPGRSVRVLFLDASDDAVLRRFNETRRPHPLLTNRLRSEVLDAIRLERERLAPLRALATAVIDTSGMRPHDLRRRVTAMMRTEGAGAAHMQVRLLSFGFKFGVPSDADLLFDVRFLDNPYFVEGLRELTGEDQRVRDHVMKDPGAGVFLDKVRDLLAFLLPRYEAEGKSYLTVAIGCTGGQHRSVAISIMLREALATQGFVLRVVHRDAPHVPHHFAHPALPPVDTAHAAPHAPSPEQKGAARG